VPNGVVTSGNIINLSGQGERRVDMFFIVDEPNEVAKVKQVIYDALGKCPFILNTKSADVFLLEFNCDELRFAVRPWCKSEDYWDVWAFMQEAIKNGFDEADLIGNINYIQMVNGRGDLN
jgi:small conductance mechanosensitive channel